MVATGGVVELGKRGRQEQKLPIDKITDLEQLHRMLRESNSRGKKQRIKKRVAALEGTK